MWRASTHLYENVAALEAGKSSNEDGRFFYGRRGSPTQWSLAEALTEMEPGAHGTMLYPSGVAAIACALLSVLKAGDILLMTDNAYDPSRSMATGLLARMGVTTDFFDPDTDPFGRLFRHSMVNVGAAVIDGAARLRADLYFMGVTGVHPEAGLSTGDAEEAAVKRALHERAAETVVLASAEKLMAASPFVVAPLQALSTLVVPGDTPARTVRALRAGGVEVHKAGR